MIAGLCIVIPKIEESQHLWNYAILNFPPESIFLLGDRDLWVHDKAVKRAISISSIDELPDAPRVLMHAREDAIPLGQFEHPDGAIYIFGADDARLDPSIEADHHVVIPTGSTDEMFAAVAYSVTAWDQSNG